MKRWPLTLAVLAMAAFAPVFGQGPGPEQGAVLRQPWDAPTSQPRPTTARPSNPAASVQNLWRQPGAAAKLSSERDVYTLAPTAQFEINRDIEVTPNIGPWMICLMSYAGPDAPQKAREMVSRLRETYRLHAYVFNHGAEEKRKEYERLKAKLEKQHQELEKQRALLQAQMPDQEIKLAPVNVATTRIQENCAILIGGYPSDQAAKDALNAIRKLDPKRLLHERAPGQPDPLFETQFYRGINPETQQEQAQRSYVNPFKRAFVVRNPSVPTTRAAENEKLDLEVLRKLNSWEEYSLLKCRKPYTLAIKQFQTPTTVQQRSESGGVLQTLGLSKGMREDYAAENAHNLAKGLRQMNLEAYVLHTRFASVVSIGNYDSLEDPNLQSMQNLLEARLRIDHPALQLMPRPLPMEVPQ